MKLKFLNIRSSKKNKFKFEDKIIIVNGFYSGCIGYVKEQIKNNRYSVILEDGAIFKSKHPKILNETDLELYNKNETKDKESSYF